MDDAFGMIAVDLSSGNTSTLTTPGLFHGVWCDSEATAAAGMPLLFAVQSQPAQPSALFSVIQFNPSLQTFRWLHDFPNTKGIVYPGWDSIFSYNPANGWFGVSMVVSLKATRSRILVWDSKQNTSTIYNTPKLMESAIGALGPVSASSSTWSALFIQLTAGGVDVVWGQTTVSGRGAHFKKTGDSGSKYFNGGQPFASCGHNVLIPALQLDNQQLLFPVDPKSGAQVWDLPLQGLVPISQGIGAIACF